MASSLYLVHNLAERIHKIKCKYGHDDKQCKTCKIKYKDCECFLEYANFKDDLVEYKCLYYNKNYQKNLYENLKKQCFNTYRHSNCDINKLILFLQKSVYVYESMDDWEKINETSLPKKEGFYSNLNMENINDADSKHSKKGCKDFEIKYLGEYDDLYVQDDTLLLADVFENFGNVCLEIYELSPARFFLLPQNYHGNHH